MSNILVTGATGFIGRNLVQTLVDRGDRVTCLVRRKNEDGPFASPNVVQVLGDITDPVSVKKTVEEQTTVFHLAGRIAAIRKEEFEQVNAGGTRNIAEACAASATPPTLVFVSSLAAAGPIVDGRPRTETDPPAPISDYGRSKRHAELAAREFADRVPTSIVRPGIVFGPGDPALLKAFRAPYYLRAHAFPRLGKARYSLIYVDDLIDLLLKVAADGSRIPREETDPTTGKTDPRGVYFAACEADPTYKELGRIMGRELGRRVTVPIPSPMPIIWTTATMNSLVARITRKPASLGIDKAREIAAGSWQCSSLKAREELEFHVEVPLADRIRQTGKWYLENGWL